MAIQKLAMKNVTVFDEITLEFSKGVNVLIGSNGVGKTHVMKLLYSACQAVRHDVSFPHKVVRTFRPEESCLTRLMRSKNRRADVQVFSDNAKLCMIFTNFTKRWNATVADEEEWEEQNKKMESVFIPAKEILSHACNLTEAASKGNVEFDDTYIDLIASAKIDISNEYTNGERLKLLTKLNATAGGHVFVQDEHFYLIEDRRVVEFPLLAEGLRKIALLSRLIQNGALEKGSVLFWDEPEANLNPEHIPMIADLLLLLQREGVQVFVSTHDYFLAKYLDGRAKEEDEIAFFAFYREGGGVLCEKKDTFPELEHNPIMDTFMALYREELRRGME